MELCCFKNRSCLSSWILLLIFISVINEATCSCDAFHYLSNSQCEPCPLHTRRFPSDVGNVHGTSKQQCSCLKNYYAQNGSGSLCFMCPLGAVCEGGIAQPYPKEGYFGDASHPDMFLPCTDHNACQGGSNHTCSEFWEGQLCAKPVVDRFKFGVLSVSCPKLGTNSLRIGNRTTEIAVLCIIVASFICFWMLIRIVVYSATSESWHCLQVVALASKINHLPWTPFQLNSMNIIAQTVLMDFRSLGLVLGGCSVFPDFGNFPTTELLVGVGPLFIVVIMMVASRGCRTSTHILRSSLLLVFTLFELLSCQSFPDGEVRLLAYPEVICWEDGHSIAALICLLFLLYFIGALVLEYMSGSSTFGDLCEVLVLYVLAACTAFGFNQPSEVALCFFLSSLLRAPSTQHPATSPIEPTFVLLSQLAVAVFSVLCFVLLYSQHSIDLSRVEIQESWHWAAVVTFMAGVVWLVPLCMIMLIPLMRWADELSLNFEAAIATSSTMDLVKWETVQLVLVKNQSTGYASHSHPRLMVTVMKSRNGGELVKANGRINSRVVQLNPATLQPVSAHFLTYSFDNILSSSTFRVQVLDVTSEGQDVVRATGTFTMSMLQEGETTVVVPLISPQTSKLIMSSTISCTYGIPGELLALREQASHHTVTAVLGSLCVESRPPMESGTLPLFPTVVSAFARQPQRLPQDFELLRCFAECVQTTREELSTGGFGEVCRLLIHHVDPRFLDLVVQECESEAQRQGMHQLFQLLQFSRACETKHLLPFQSPFVVDWILRCKDPNLEAGIATLAQLAATHFIVPKSNNPSSDTQRNPSSTGLQRSHSSSGITRNASTSLQRNASSSGLTRNASPSLQGNPSSSGLTRNTSPSLQRNPSSSGIPIDASSIEMSSLGSLPQPPLSPPDCPPSSFATEPTPPMPLTLPSVQVPQVLSTAGADSEVVEAAWENPLEGFVSFIFGPPTPAEPTPPKNRTELSHF